METEEQQLTKKEKNILKKQAKLEARDNEKKSRRSKRIVAWGLVLAIVLLGGYFMFSGSDESDDQAEQITQDHIKGAPNAPVTLIEYGDFQCPACRSYFPLVKQIEADYGESVSIIYRNFPLNTIHPNAQEGSQAAEAAGLQDKFWEMHDMLFIRQDEWSPLRNPKERLAEYAQELGLDREKFLSDYESKSVKRKIEKDQSLGRRQGASGTPTFILNEQKIEPRSYEEFAQLLEQAGAVLNPADTQNLNATTTPVE